MVAEFKECNKIWKVVEVTVSPKARKPPNDKFRSCSRKCYSREKKT